MVSLSLCMIVKNEEEVLDRCLKSCYKIFDEIVIVDTGSTDKTKEIAKKYTNKVLDFKWCDDFSKARNFSILNSNCDYFMWLDADDILTKKSCKQILELKQKLTNEDIVMLKYDVSFDENNKTTFSYYRERIIKNYKKFLFTDPVHEVIIPSGKIIYEDISVEHRKIKENKKNRNLKIYENLKKQKVEFSARQQFYYARELFFNNRIDKAIINFKKFLKIKNAFIENKIEACLNLSKCYLIKNNFKKAKEILFYSFDYDLPRSEILCEIAYIYKQQNDFIKAIYYFELATKNKPNFTNLSFVKSEYYDYIPYLELCVCYFNLKDYKKSYYYNCLAKKIKPTDKIVLNNENFLKDYI